MTDFQKQIDKLASHKTKWMNLSIKERIKFVKSLRHLIVDKQNEIAKAITIDTGKPVAESIMQEVSATLGMLKYFESHFPRWMNEREFRYFRPGFILKKNVIQYYPLGIVAIISPSNYPFSLAVMQTVFTILCGNCVILKPSEKAPEVNKIIKLLFESSGLIPECVLVIEGDKKVAEEIIKHYEIKKIIFTGDYENGKKVAKLAGEFFKPVILELGGEGPAVVLNDANLTLAAKSIVWSHSYCNFSSCIGTKIVFVQKDVVKGIKEILLDEFSKINFGSSNEKTTDASVKDKRDLSSLNLIEFQADEEVIEQINKLQTGLSASIWSGNIRRARKLADKLNCGMVWINDVSVGIPGMAWGGNKQSGWGRLFSREAITELTNIKTISMERRYTSQTKFWQYPYSKDKYTITEIVNSVVFGKERIIKLIKVMSNYYNILFRKSSQ